MKHLPIEVLLRQRDEAAARYHDVKESLVLWAVTLWQGHHREEIQVSFDRAAQDVVNVERVFRRISRELDHARRAYERRLRAKTSQRRAHR